jgi:hypothetical protein
MIDLKALMGDSSDNIPGVPGVGEKTASALIQEYGSIDAIYKAMPDVHAKPAALKKLAEGEDSARHSYWLATIVTDAPVDFRPADNLLKAPSDAAYPLFLKLEFSRLIEKFDLRPAQPEQETPEQFQSVCEMETAETAARAEELLALWRRADHVSVLALPDLTGVAVYCETGKGSAGMSELFFNRYDGDWNAFLTALFAADVKKVSHNVKDLMRLLLEERHSRRGLRVRHRAGGVPAGRHGGAATSWSGCSSPIATRSCPSLCSPRRTHSPCWRPGRGGGRVCQPRHRRGRACTTAFAQAGGKADAPALRHGGAAAVPCAGGDGAGGLPGGRRGAGRLRRTDGAALRGAGKDRFTPRRAGNSTSIPPSSWARCSSSGCSCRHGKKTKTGWSHQRRRAGKAAGKHPWSRHTGLPAVCQAQIHLCRRAFEGHGPRRPHSHQLSDDRHRHRAAVLHGAESAEHPHPHGAGQRDTQDVRPRRRETCWWTRTTPR